MINYFANVDFDQIVYTLSDGPVREIERQTLRDLATDWAETTTTPLGVAPKMYTEGLRLRSWGHVGNHDHFIFEFETEAEAEHALLMCHLHDLDNNDCAPLYYNSIEDLLADYADVDGIVMPETPGGN